MKKIIKIGKSLKQILNDSNISLINRGLNSVRTLNDIPSEVEKLGEINRLPYFFRDEIVELNENDFGSDSIRSYMCYEYNSLTTVIIPDNVTVIESYAFYHCENLASVVIGSGITTIEDAAFRYCNQLFDIYIYTSTVPSLASTVTIETDDNLKIHVPIGSGDAYKSATNWSSYAKYIVEDLAI